MKRKVLAVMFLLIFVFTGCAKTQTAVEPKVEPEVKTKIEPKIARFPAAENLSYLHGKLDTLPAYDPTSNANWQVDVRSADLSSLDLHDRLTDLLHADFDSNTVWPDKLPKEFDPIKIMELGRDPGLNVRALHKKGIMGKGVSIAIIDQPLLVKHIEYTDRVKVYEEINIPRRQPAQMHGSAVSSIAVGKTVGVAPEADLYYIAQNNGTNNAGKFEWDFTDLAQAMNRILDMNKELPKENKIRVISISVGWSPDQKGYDMVTEAVERAKQEGVFIVSSSLQETFGFKFHGLGRNALSDPNNLNQYLPGSWWAQRYYDTPTMFGNDMLLVPMDSRCTASPTGNEDYVFYADGGWSWSIPYIAGLYALACQVKPDITPEIFWEQALKTGTTIDIDKNGKTYKLGKIVDPVKLIESLQKK